MLGSRGAKIPGPPLLKIISYACVDLGGRGQGISPPTSPRKNIKIIIFTYKVTVNRILKECIKKHHSYTVLVIIVKAHNLSHLLSFFLQKHMMYVQMQCIQT